jgi:hypothetical protein
MTATGRTSGDSSRAPAQNARRKATTTACPCRISVAVSRSSKRIVGNGVSRPEARTSGRHSSCSAR